jgi:hypothetical protein
MPARTEKNGIFHAVRAGGNPDRRQKAAGSEDPAA